MKIFSPFYKRPPKLDPPMPTTSDNDVMIKSSSSEKISTPPRIQSATTSSQVTSIRKLCNEYKIKYLAKNRENLDYEKRLIHMNGQLERLKLDLTYSKEHNDKLQEKVSELEKENNELKQQISKLNHKNRDDDKENNQEPVENWSPEFKIHETFLCSRAILEDKINTLKIELKTGQNIKK